MNEIIELVECKYKPVELEQLSPCECGEHEHIYIKRVYMSFNNDVWVVECQRCGNIVPVVSREYDSEKFVTAWNAWISR